MTPKLSLNLTLFDPTDKEDLEPAIHGTGRGDKTNNEGYTKTQDERWNEIFQRLIAYKTQHKTIHVPNRYSEDP